MGCTIRIEDRLVRVVEGSEKSSAWSPEKRPSGGVGQNIYDDSQQRAILPRSFSHLLYIRSARPRNRCHYTSQRHRNHSPGSCPRGWP